MKNNKKGNIFMCLFNYPFTLSVGFQLTIKLEIVVMCI